MDRSLTGETIERRELAPLVARSGAIGGLATLAALAPSQQVLRLDL